MRSAPPSGNSIVTNHRSERASSSFHRNNGGAISGGNRVSSSGCSITSRLDGPAPAKVARIHPRIRSTDGQNGKACHCDSGRGNQSHRQISNRFLHRALVDSSSAVGRGGSAYRALYDTMLPCLVSTISITTSPRPREALFGGVLLPYWPATCPSSLMPGEPPRTVLGRQALLSSGLVVAGSVLVREEPRPSVRSNQSSLYSKLSMISPAASRSSISSPPLFRLPAYWPTTGSFLP